MNNKKINELDLVNEYIPLLVSLGFDRDDLVKQVDDLVRHHKEYYEDLFRHRGKYETPKIKLDFQSIQPYKKDYYTICWYMPTSESATEYFLMISCETVFINIFTGKKTLAGTLLHEIREITENSLVSEFVNAIKTIESNINETKI